MMSEDTAGLPAGDPQGEGCARYFVAIIATILLAPALVGLALAVAAGEPIALFVVTFYGAIFATPLVLIGAALHAILARHIEVHWWHSALAGFALMMIVIVAMTFPPTLPENDGYWSLLLFLGVGAIGGLIFHYFVRPKNAKRNHEALKDE